MEEGRCLDDFTNTGILFRIVSGIYSFFGDLTYLFFFFNSAALRHDRLLKENSPSV